MKKFILLIVLHELAIFSAYAQGTTIYSGGQESLIHDEIFYGGVHEFKDPIYLFPCERIFRKTAFTIITERENALQSIPKSHRGWERLFVSPNCYYFPPRQHMYDFLAWYMEVNFKIKLPLISLQDYIKTIFNNEPSHSLKSANYKKMICKKYHVLYMSANTFNTRMEILEDYAYKSGYNYTYKNQLFLRKYALYDGLFIKVLVPIIEE